MRCEKEIAIEPHSLTRNVIFRGRIGFPAPRKYGLMIKTVFLWGDKALYRHQNTVS